jgi:Fic family protein
LDLDRLNQSPIGRLVPIRGSDARHGDFAYFAYLPDPLPEDVTLASATWAAITEASTALARLGQACTQLGEPQLLIRPALWREALDTSALEGTNGALRDLLESQLPSAQYLTPETIEIRAYFQTAEYAFAAIYDRPLTVGLLNELQEQLFKETQNRPRDVGRLRRDHVWIGEKDRPIQEARFVPVPADDRLRSELDAWESWVRAGHPHLAPVLRAALAHYQFETLHPYGDGNGRIGRLVVVLQLLSSKALDFPALTVSPWFLKRRDEYQDRLLNVSCTGEWDPWVMFFCHALRDQCMSLCTGAQRLIEWRDEAHRQVQARRWSGTIHQLLDGLLVWPVVTVADTAARFDVSVVHATRMINHLVEIGILHELTGKTYNRIFGALDVMEIVEAI